MICAHSVRDCAALDSTATNNAKGKSICPTLATHATCLYTLIVCSLIKADIAITAPPPDVSKGNTPLTPPAAAHTAAAA